MRLTIGWKVLAPAVSLQQGQTDDCRGFCPQDPGAEGNPTDKPTCVKGRQVNCPKAFVGRRVALRHTSTDGIFELCYRSHLLALVDLRQNAAETVLDVPERVSSMSPV